MDGNPSSTNSLAKATLSNLENSHLVLSLLFSLAAYGKLISSGAYGMQFVHRFLIYTAKIFLHFNRIVKPKMTVLLSFTLAHVIANSFDFILRTLFHVFLMNRN